MQRLELTWIGKGEDPEVEPRILMHDPSMDYGDPNAGNMLIHGDNLLALKALEQDYAGKIKLICIDPPYNTGAAFEQYDDNLEHSTWLNLMKSRLVLLKSLLSDDGSIWICIDDNEQAYLQVLCDEIFGRKCHVQTVIWRSSDNSNNDSKQFSQDHNYVLVYSKKPSWQPNKLARTEEQAKHYSNPDNDPRGPWFDGNPLGSPNPRPNLIYDIIAPNGNVIKPPLNGWRWSEQTLKEKMETGEIRFNEDCTGIRRRTYLYEQKGLPPSSLWADIAVTGHTRQAKYEQKKLFPEMNKNSWFATPKPEKLIRQILSIATDEGDIVLDSFLGSGTTAAVAQKMGRRWIGIELGDHCFTHCKPRLDKVIDGERGGISKEEGWAGGGGYKFYELAPTLLVEDAYGNPVFSDKYSPEMLVAAVAKLNGFRYAPNSDVFWKQGCGQDKSYIYVTTQYLTSGTVDGIAADMEPTERLLVCAPAFDLGLGERYDNITVKKIPQSILDKCEYGVDDYNLNVVDLPVCEDEEWEDD